MDTFFDFVARIGPLLTFASALIAAGIAYNFGRVQADIARRQAATAASVAATARNKLRLDLFEKRMAIYTIVTERMDTARLQGQWSVDQTPYFRKVSAAKWLFDQAVNNWIAIELAAVLLEVATTQADCETTQEEPGPIRLEKVIAASGAGMKLDAQYGRRDAAFAPFLHLKDE